MPVLPCPNRQDAGWILQLGLSLTWACAADTRFLTYAFGRAVDNDPNGAQEGAPVAARVLMQFVELVFLAHRRPCKK